MLVVFVASEKHEQHVAIIDGHRYFRSYAVGRTKTDRRAYYKAYRAKRRRVITTKDEKMRIDDVVVVLEHS